MRDILIFMSDQHSYGLMGNAGNTIVRTPYMDRLAREGVSWTDAMTSCPLCVPARMSFLSGLLPSRTGVLDNVGVLHSGQVTFVHCLNAAGYETVLCGRMHFVGPDQRHGFEKRIAGDRTPLYQNQPEGGHKCGPFRGFMEEAAIRYMGPGNSPVLAYDNYVVDRALAYLKEDHERPQFLTVGTYAPHFPYTAPKELYDYYYERVPLDENDYSGYQEHPALEGKLHDTDPEVVRAARANYYGMAEFTDQKLGQVFEAFCDYTKRNGHEGIVIYLSDHGDMNGQRGYYGKDVFYDPSVHIPVLFWGDGIRKSQTIGMPTSIMDVGPTLCEMADAPKLPRTDGKSLWWQMAEGGEPMEGENSRMSLWENRSGKAVDDRAVISEVLDVVTKDSSTLGRMVRWKQWKYFAYSGFEGQGYLFDCRENREELRNVAGEHPDVVKTMKGILSSYPAAETVCEHQRWQNANFEVLRQCNFDSDERWRCPPEACVPLEEYVCTKQPERMPKWLRVLVEGEKKGAV